MATVDPHIAYINFLEKKERIHTRIKEAVVIMNRMKAAGQRPTPEAVQTVARIVAMAKDQLKRAQDEYIEELK